jgi:hypothetical protein
VTRFGLLTHVPANQTVTWEGAAHLRQSPSERRGLLRYTHSRKTGVSTTEMLPPLLWDYWLRMVENYRPDTIVRVPVLPL